MPDLADFFLSAPQERAVLGAAAAGYTPVNDRAYQILATDCRVAFTAMSAPRTLTLPAAASYSPGQTLYLGDGSGQCSSTNLITIQVSGSDTIITASQGASMTLGTPGQKLAFHSDGIDGWTYS